ncbi:MAG: division/cell wall cluster transcriptional repressor MraZ [Aerococcus sp.]|nr:division/cell wall cluster transcriptional repressor MraZ [Aerococcus sp.]
MLMGEYQHNLDGKGRLIIPAKWRTELGDSFVVTRGLDGCIFGYPLSAWEDVQKQMKALPLAKKNARAFSRFFYSAAAEVTIDKQGRINLPQSLLEFAHLEKACHIIGVNERLEIWDEETWQQTATDIQESYEDIAEDLFDFGL